MPVMEGYTASSLLKNDDKYKEVPIFALTAAAMKHEMEQYGSIVDELILKPINKYDLIEKISITFAEEKLSEMLKQQFTDRFLPTIVGLQTVLNFDDLIEFGADLEKFASRNDLSQLKEFCYQLNDQAASYNIDKIHNSLLQIVGYLNKN